MIRLIADSSCDMLSMENIDFRCVPMTISTNDNLYRDDKNLDLPAMLKDLAAYKGRSFTACPSVGDWMNAYEGAEACIVVTITSGLSGTYRSAMAAKELYLQSHPDAKIHVIDSLATGPAMRVILEECADMIHKGLSFEEITEQADAFQKKTHLLFALQTLHNMAQNGRVNPLVAAAIGMMNIRIVAIASAEGTVEPIAKCRGDKKTLAELVKQLQAMGYTGQRLRISHVQNPTLANELALRIREAFPLADIHLYPATGLVSYYAEQSGLLIGFEA